MAILSPLRSRRFATRQSEITKQLIAFRLRQEWFALPIDTVQKVVPLGNIYGDPQATGVSLTLYQGQELLVVDVGYRIFAEVPAAIAMNKITEQNEYDISKQRYLLIVQSKDKKSIGLPIDSPPAIRRVVESNFIPLPEAYISQGNIQCVSSTIVQVKDQPPLFLLDPEQLAHPEQIVGKIS